MQTSTVCFTLIEHTLSLSTFSPTRMPSSSPKFFYARSSQPSTRRSTVLIITCCLIIGITGFIIGLTSLFFASPISTSKCRSSTSPSRSIRVVWDRLNGVAGAGAGNGNNVVGDQRKKVMGFVGIQTGFDSAGRRRSLRQTWMPSDAQGLQRLEEATGLAVRFVIGWTKNEAKMAELQKEIVEYDDFIRLDIEEEYSKLPYKTLAFFKAAYALYNSEFYVKADDDIYLRPDRLSLLLVKERSHPQTYLGCMKKGQVFSDPNIKWYEPLSYMLGNEYFLHAYGPIYALSTDVVTSLAALHNNSFRMFSNEDVTIGSWMLAMNVNHENNLELCSPECTESSIAVWDIPKCSGLCSPEKRLLELHQMDICSKSPTLASDDD